MSRMGVLLLSFVVLQLTLAKIQPGAHDTLVQRLKRSPQYCGPPYPPPPPPPPFWPPPPPPPRHWPPPPPPPQYQFYTVADSQSGASQSGASQSGAIQQGSGCSTCGGTGESSAISNAESGTGDAIAVAVAKARSSGK